MLYRLAQTSPGLFHDITSGDNLVACADGTQDCKGGMLGYSTTPGYDLVTGLGSMDANTLAMAWSSTVPPGATTAVDASPSSFTLSDSVQLTATVVSSDATVTPTGNVSFTLGTRILGDVPLTGAGGTATAAITVYGGQFPAGSDTVLASYNGDATFNGSSASAVVNVAIPTTHSAVVPSVSPNPVYQDIPDADGYSWSFTIRLTEVAGVGATLTGFTINGATEQPSAFFNSLTIPPNGTISGGVRIRGITIPAFRVLGFTGVDASGFQWSQQISFPLYGLAFRTTINTVLNEASPQAAYAPGMILAVAGGDLALSSQMSTTFPLPTTLAKTTATINARRVCSACFRCAGENGLADSLRDGAAGIAVLNVNNNGEMYSFSFKVAASAPGIFTDAENNLLPVGSGSAGQVVTLTITGDGLVSPPLADGATPAPGTPMNQLPAPQLPVTVTLGKLPAKVQFVGIPSGNVGITRIDFVVPVNAAPGVQPVVVTVGGVASPAANFTVVQ